MQFCSLAKLVQIVQINFFWENKIWILCRTSARQFSSLIQSGAHDKRAVAKIHNIVHKNAHTTQIIEQQTLNKSSTGKSFNSSKQYKPK